ncbi:hypothetical protein JCM5350_006110 [Sporobolomyces pararoseus]
MSTETTSHENSTRIDHLSRLPNELLEDIFDHAYCTSPPPPMPISKRLLPFHQKHLYRQVLLSSSSRVKKFLTSVSKDKEKGKIVKSLELKRKKSFKIKSTEALEKLFPLLPNLEHLGFCSKAIPNSKLSKVLFLPLSKVTSFTFEIKTVLDYDYLDLGSFAFLTAFPSLAILKLSDWPIVGDTVFEEEKDMFELECVTTLVVAGRGAEDASVAEFVKRCPAVLHLDLLTTFDDDYTSFLYCLPNLPTTLEFLKLDSTAQWSNLTSYDHLLLRFTNLRSLDLGDGLYSKTIHKTLQRLPLLEKIRLGGGSISPLDFLPLLSGKTRLVNLEFVTLDFGVGARGSQVTELSSLELLPDIGMGDWKLPEASPRIEALQTEDEENEEVAEYLDFAELKQLVEVAEENGVQIGGSVHEGLKNLEDYWIEKSNRAIVLAYNGYDTEFEFEWLQKVRADAAAAGVTLPHLNVDALDLKRLELVKIDQAERVWFIFSLRNREDKE